MLKSEEDFERPVRFERSVEHDVRNSVGPGREARRAASVGTRIRIPSHSSARGEPAMSAALSITHVAPVIPIERARSYSAPAHREDRAVETDAVSAPALAGRPVQPRLRLTRRGRIVLAVIALAPVALLIGLGFIQGQAASAADATTASSPSVPRASVTVGVGESLWDIAERIAGDRDVRDVIVEIRALNGLHGSTVEAGQRLVLPATPGDAAR